MAKLKPGQAGFSASVLVVASLVVLVIGGVGFLVFKRSTEKKAAITPATTSTPEQPVNNNPSPQTPVDPYKGWKTYNSSEENAVFRYPTDWTVTQSNIPSAGKTSSDIVGIKSPSGAITISWAPVLGGFANGNNGSYPLNAVIDKTAITGSPGLYVVSGTTTLDGKTYYPWIAVQDRQGIISSGVEGNIAAFQAKHAKNPSTNSTHGRHSQLPDYGQTACRQRSLRPMQPRGYPARSNNRLN